MGPVNGTGDDAFPKARTFRVLVAVAQAHHLRVEFAGCGMNVKANAFTRPHR